MGHQIDQDLPLLGLRILVADDEFLIAVGIEDALRDAGAEVVTAATLALALRAARDTELSAALLDVRLGRQTTEAVADELGRRGIPFLFYSGQALPEPIRAKHPLAAMLTKPARHDAFVKAMLDIMRD